MKFYLIATILLVAFALSIQPVDATQCAIPKAKVRAFVTECAMVSKKVQSASKKAILIAAQFACDMKSWAIMLQDGIEAFLTDDTDEELALIFEPTNNRDSASLQEDGISTFELQTLPFHVLTAQTVSKVYPEHHEDAMLQNHEEKATVPTDDEGYIFVNNKETAPEGSAQDCS